MNVHISTIGIPFWLVVPKSELRGYVLESDRLRFSHPIPVEWRTSEVSTRLANCYDLVRGCCYPAERRLLKPFWALTRKQRDQL